MNSHQRRKARRVEKQFTLTPEGAALAKALDEFDRVLADSRSWLTYAKSREKTSDLSMKLLMT